MRAFRILSLLSLMCLVPAAVHAQTNPRVAGRRPTPRTTPSTSTSSESTSGTLDNFKSLVKPISPSLLAWVADIDTLVKASKQYDSVDAMNRALADVKVTVIPKIQQDLKAAMTVDYGDPALTRERRAMMTGASTALAAALAQYQGNAATRSLSLWPNQPLVAIATGDFIKAALDAEAGLRTRVPAERAHAAQVISAIGHFPRGDLLTREVTLAFERIAKSPEGRLTPANAPLVQPVADGFERALTAAIASTSEAR